MQESHIPITMPWKWLPFFLEIKNNKQNSSSQHSEWGVGGRKTSKTPLKLHLILLKPTTSGQTRWNEEWSLISEQNAKWTFTGYTLGHVFIEKQILTSRFIATDIQRSRTTYTEKQLFSLTIILSIRIKILFNEDNRFRKMTCAYF